MIVPVQLSASWRFVVFVFLPIVTVALIVGRLAGTPSAQRVVAAVQAAAGEWWAIPLFLAAYVAAALLLLPVGVLSVAAAVAWGWRLGGAIELVTCTLAALVPFYLARGPLAPWIERRLGATPLLSRERSGFALLLLRILPLVPYVALNYLAGMARLRTREYVLGTFFGSIPSVFAFAYFVDTMAAGVTGAATQARVLAICAAAALGVLIARWIASRVASRLS